MVNKKKKKIEEMSALEFKAYADREYNKSIKKGKQQTDAEWRAKVCGCLKCREDYKKELIKQKKPTETYRNVEAEWRERFDKEFGIGPLSGLKGTNPEAYAYKGIALPKDIKSFIASLLAKQLELREKEVAERIKKWMVKQEGRLYYQCWNDLLDFLNTEYKLKEKGK